MMTGKNRREEILSALKRVPLLSPHASRLLQITAGDEHSLTDLVDVVKLDTNLTARVLRVVNSAIYGLINPISTIDRAISYLGERMIVCLAIGDSAGVLFSKEMTGYQSKGGELWKHDLFTAIAAREIARTVRSHELPIDLAYTAGLMHDIGKSVLSDFLNGTAERLVGEIARGEVHDYLDGEQELLGMDHAELGLELARHWQLPEMLQAPIGWHHRPGETPEQYRPLAYAVHLGDIIAMMSGCATGSDGMQYRLDERYKDYFLLQEDDLPMILLTATEEFQKTEASLREG